jgi:hypothetical protein
MDHAMMCVDLGPTHFDRWDFKIRGMVGEWLGIHGLPVELSQMFGRNGGFSFPSL